MTRDQLVHLLAIAEQSGADAALQAYDAAEDDYEAECDSRAAADFERDAYGDDPFGPTNDDEFDKHGNRLRPRVNDAGEPWWM